MSISMTEQEYEKLRKERDELVRVKGNKRHGEQIKVRLSSIREQLKQAHRGRIYEERIKNGQHFKHD